MTGRYIAIEGIDGAGKTTVAEAVVESLRNDGHRVELVREPGGTRIGEAIRQIVLHSDDDLSPWSEALLFAAARAQLAQEVVAPLLAEGVWVVTDRSVFSSLAYQGAGRGLGVETVREVNAPGLGDAWPDLVILLALDAAEGLSRQGDPDRIGGAGVELQQRVADAYSGLSTEPSFATVDARGSFEAVVQDCLEVIRERW